AVGAEVKKLPPVSAPLRLYAAAVGNLPPRSEVRKRRDVNLPASRLVSIERDPPPIRRPVFLVFDDRCVHEQTGRALAVEGHCVDRLAKGPEDDESAIGRPLIEGHILMKRDERFLLTRGDILYEHSGPPRAKRGERKRALVRSP